MGLTQHAKAVPGQLEGLENAGPKRVIQIMVQVGDPIRAADAFALQRFRKAGPGMTENAVADLCGQIQTMTVPLQAVHHAQALLVVTEAILQEMIQRPFSDMAERGVPEIMPQGDGLCQILVQAQGTGQRPRHLGHLEGMGQAGAIVIPLGREKDLGFKLQAAKGLAVNDPVPVPLIHRAQIAGGEGGLPARGLRGVGGVGGEEQVFIRFRLFTNGHGAAPFSRAGVDMNNIQRKDKKSCFLSG